MIHSASIDSGQKIASASLVAFKRSTEADHGSSRNRTKLPSWTRMENERTTWFTGNIEGFEGIRTPLDQRRRQ